MEPTSDWLASKLDVNFKRVCWLCQDPVTTNPPQMGTSASDPDIGENNTLGVIAYCGHMFHKSCSEEMARDEDSFLCPACEIDRTHPSCGCPIKNFELPWAEYRWSRVPRTLNEEGTLSPFCADHVQVEAARFLAHLLVQHHADAGNWSGTSAVCVRLGNVAAWISNAGTCFELEMHRRPVSLRASDIPDEAEQALKDWWQAIRKTWIEDKINNVARVPHHDAWFSSERMRHGAACRSCYRYGCRGFVPRPAEP